jgi:hypothetical protein
MRILIEFLLHELCSSNGLENTAQHNLNELYKHQTFGKFNQKVLSSLEPSEIDLIKLHNKN